MFNQFHDILPGSGVHATYEHAQGLFQEILAKTSMIKTRNLRAIAAIVNTETCCPCEEVKKGVGPGIGGGPGDIRADGELSRLCAGSGSCDPFVIFNPSPWSRTELVVARLWDRECPADQIAVTDESGKSVRAQFVEKGNYWGHTFIDVAFPAADVPAVGYRSFSVARMPAPAAKGPCTGDGKGVIENEFYRVEVEQGSGAIVRLLDKSTGVDFVRPGSRIGVLEYMLEAPHGMTAWCFGQIVKTVPLVEGATLECSQNGPFVASVRARRKFNESSFTTTIALAAGVPRVDFTLEADWWERGTRESGVPMLKVAFALAADGKVATFECANGSVTRPCDTREVRSYTRDLAGFYWPHNVPMDPAPGEVPMQRWMDLSGKVAGVTRPAGVTLVNDCKYGCSIADNVVRLTLLRSSSDPDPAPEMGRHVIRWALRPHVGKWSASDATREGAGFNLPFNVVGTTRQQGRLPASKSFAEILTPNVMLSALKKAEDSDAVVVRLYEMEGRATTARLRLDKTICPAGACAVETDTLEQPLARSSARMRRGVLSVRVPAFGVVTVKIG
jgi:alpha-mannosidase